MLPSTTSYPGYALAGCTCDNIYLIFNISILPVSKPIKARNSFALPNFVSHRPGTTPGTATAQLFIDVTYEQKRRYRIEAASQMDLGGNLASVSSWGCHFRVPNLSFLICEMVTIVPISQHDPGYTMKKSI